MGSEADSIVVGEQIRSDRERVDRSIASTVGTGSASQRECSDRSFRSSHQNDDGCNHRADFCMIVL